MKNNNAKHALLDLAVTHGQTKAQALDLIRSLNHDSQVNYPFSARQVENITTALDNLKAAGWEYTEDSYEDFGDGGNAFFGDKLQPDWNMVADTLNDIFEGVDENGQAFPERDQPFHFDAYPTPSDSVTHV
jgi:hypothetical protein